MSLLILFRSSAAVTTDVTGTAAGTLPALTCAASGTFVAHVTGTAACTLPPLSCSAAGTVVNRVVPPPIGETTGGGGAIYKPFKKPKPKPLRVPVPAGHLDIRGFVPAARVGGPVTLPTGYVAASSFPALARFPARTIAPAGAIRLSLRSPEPHVPATGRAGLPHAINRLRMLENRLTAAREADPWARLRGQEESLIVFGEEIHA